DAVDGPLGGGAPGVGRSAGAVCATPIPPVTGGGGLEVPLEDLLLAARGGPGIADVLGEQRSGRGEQILAVLLGEQVPVHLQASGLDALRQCGQDGPGTVVADLGRGGDFGSGHAVPGVSFDGAQPGALLRGEEGQGPAAAAGTPRAA